MLNRAVTAKLLLMTTRQSHLIKNLHPGVSENYNVCCLTAISVCCSLNSSCLCLNSARFLTNHGILILAHHPITSPDNPYFELLLELASVVKVRCILNWTSGRYGYALQLELWADTKKFSFIYNARPQFVLIWNGSTLILMANGTQRIQAYLPEVFSFKLNIKRILLDLLKGNY